MVVRYQITRFGNGFANRKHRLPFVLRKLTRRLLKVPGPYTVEEKGPFSRPEVREHVRKVLNQADPGTKLVVRGVHYDSPSWAVRSIKVERVEASHPMVNWVQQFVSKSPYLLGAQGPPGKSDCSSTTMNAAQHVYGITLAHSAAQQATDTEHFRFFHDPAELEPDDFVFYNYGRLAWPTADHVELWMGPRGGGFTWKRWTIGSRPSTGGVNYYAFTSYDASRVVTYGRLKKG
jgi:hypothetical protein